MFRKHYSRIILAALLAGLAACGGGGGGGGGNTSPSAAPAPVSNPAPKPAEVVVPPRKVLVVMYGDSVQKGDWAETNTAKEAMAFIPEGVAELRVEAVNGAVAKQLMLGWGLRSLQESMEALKPDYVSIGYGINDHLFPLDQFREHITALTLQAKSLGAGVILQTPNPVNDPIYGDVAARAEIIRQVAGDNAVVLCDHWNDGMRLGLQNEFMEGPIGAHPNSKQYKAMGELFAKCLAQAMEHD
jgi:lysophospholipase L1-like esterase